VLLGKESDISFMRRGWGRKEKETASREVKNADPRAMQPLERKIRGRPHPDWPSNRSEGGLKKKGKTPRQG